MKKEKFFELFGKIDDKNLELAPAKKVFPKIASISAAACVCMILLVSVILTHTFSPEQNEQGENHESTDSHNEIVNFVQNIEWKYATDIAKEKDETYYGVSVPAFFVYENTFYILTQTTENEKYTENTTPLYLSYMSKDYPYTVYSAKSNSEHIALFINRQMNTYRPLFYIDTASNSGKYNLLYYAAIEQKNAALKNSTVFENETVKIYPLDENLYIADISQPLKSQLPNLFAGEDNFAHFYYIATFEEYSHYDETEGTYIKAITPEDLNDKTKDIFCGAYLEDGKYTVLLKNCTEEEIELVCRELSIDKNTTVFKTGTYTLDYLTNLQEKITAGMMNKEFDFISSSGVYESENIISVSVLFEDEEGIKKLLALDTLGNAIKIEYTGAQISPLTEELTLLN